MNTLNHTELEVVYEQAYRSGRLAWSSQMSKGEPGYLKALDNIVQSPDVASEVSLGLIDIPIDKIVGTYTHSRSISFAQNFMPLMPPHSEFASKWMSLYAHHIKEGITDPIKVYEYLNRFFVIEGNKRVSVLKFVQGTTIRGYVTRLVPKKDSEDKKTSIYYEFMNFYKYTGINTIWFSELGRFTELLTFIRQYGELIKDEDYQKAFLANVYRPFRQLYLEEGGQKLDMTTGDAFLTFIKIYGLPVEVTPEKDLQNIKKLMSELKVLEKEASNVKTDQIQSPKKRVLTSLTDLVVPKKILKVAFVYAKTTKESGWVYAHELGRLHISDSFKHQIVTTKIENVPENDSAYETLKQLAQENYDIIFTTSPTFVAPSLKAAMEYPSIKFFNCAATHSYKSLTLYYGRIHEPRYLLGMIAGAMTQTNTIGYVAPYPISEVVSSINAFTLGARAVNPRITVKAMWTYRWDNPEGGLHVAERLREEGADIISNEDLPIPGDSSKTYGVYKIDEKTQEKTHYAMAIWNWGVFYERVIQNILNGTWKSIYEESSNPEIPMNFWLGMNTGIVDLLYSNRQINHPMKLLIESVKKSIIRNEFTIFEGPLYDQYHQLRVKSGEILDYEDIVHMDWLIEGVDGQLPDLKDLKPTDPFSYMRGLIKH
ncbi:BMP family ABC transporter substrate-binding protein [Sporanaerobium hydrogeniformans]|uniref:BMP family ABC transporter substrate-binding protein n=1 Tax=Sporanaerobium hydrogeniformans TaxID=3072179 RepID=A0AC61DD48_9FIRM|nr:BMP family ABC transporter substrate-binding protein [Sporanaerobium hydrogeniformans]PHV70663.1 BMP family ABC transporter substrate-binding protein [Sporanaerobium hydrogeniformans]